MAKKIVKVGLVQMHSEVSPEKNLDKASARVVKLAKKGVNIVALPELFLTEYFCQSRSNKFFDFAQPVPGKATKDLAAIAAKNGVVLMTSIYEFEKSSGKFFNTAVVFDADGKLVGKYRKVHIPDDGEHYYDEAYYFSPGDLGYKCVKTEVAKIGPLICYDQWFPEAARETAKKGAEILIYTTAIGWPVGQERSLNETENDAWATIQRSHAIANGVFVASVNRVGKENHLNFWGSSFVCDPYGKVLAKAGSSKEEDVIASCDLSLIDQKNKDWPFLWEC